MLTIYHAPLTRGMRLIWMAEEMGLPYELKRENLMQRSDELRALNPSNTLPVLVDGEVVVTESIAALQYLAATHGPTELAPGADDPSYPAYLQFLVFGEASLAAYLNPLVPTKLMAPEGERDNFTARMCEMMFTRRLSLLERQLATKPYAAGDAFTAADISIGYGLDLGARLGLDGSFTPAVKDYWERVRSRPSYQAAVAS